METGFDWISRYGDAAIFLLLMLGIFGLPVPDETLLTFAGYLCFKGKLLLGPTLAAAFLGSVCGITLSYGLGRLLGLHAVRRLGPMLHLRPEHLAETQRWFEHWGKYVLIILNSQRTMVDRPQQGHAADRERGGVGADHDLVQHLGVDDAVPALGAIGIAECRKVLVLVC